MHTKTYTIAITMSLLAIVGAARGEPGYPVAVTHTGEGHIVIDNFWLLSVDIDAPTDTQPRIPMPGGFNDPNASRIVVRTKRSGFMLPGVHGIHGDAVIDRKPNDLMPIKRSLDDRPISENGIAVRSVKAGDNDEAKEFIVVVDVDGIRLTHLGRFDAPELNDQQLNAAKGTDVLFVPVIGPGTVGIDRALDLTESVRPRMVVPFIPPDEATPDGGVEAFVAKLPDRYTRKARYQTMAVTADRGPTRDDPWAVVLNWRTEDAPVNGMSTALERLLERKEIAAAQSAAVFASLTVKQMNHKPSDGTHTARWNAEHMLGREFGFFSAIYSAIDPSIPHIDLNPAQMPDDYEAAHPDWSGVEEAHQIRRVQQFTRRFAYLLHDVDLESLPEGCPRFARSLRGLLQIMERHWGEHTANVEKKFDLPDWPAQ